MKGRIVRQTPRDYQLVSIMNSPHFSAQRHASTALESPRRYAAFSPIGRVLPTVIAIASVLLPVRAFPPAPGFTVFGAVRDEFGWVVNSSEATIVFKNAATGAVIADSKIGNTGSVTENYRLMLPLDHNRTGTAYRAEAVTTATSFTIEVIIEGVRYFPVPVVAPPSTQTQAAEFLHLDLMLGDDSDNDGLPDLWEQWQLEAAGLDPSRLDLLTGNGDSDGDGMSNRAEFIAGTFAFFGDDSLSLRFLTIFPDDWSSMQFLAVIDKTYLLERSADMDTWEPAPFGLWQDRTALRSDWKAPDTVLQTIQASPGAVGKRWFYRLSVQ
jgi:hypothetical protein